MARVSTSVPPSDGPPVAVSTRDVVAGGNGVRVDERGTGPRLILFVHGLGGHRGHWRAMIETAEHGLHLAALDLPGFGASPAPRSPATLDGWADTCADVARALGAQRLVVVGHSLGGAIAARVAARHPSLTEQAVLVCGAVLHLDALLHRTAPRFARRHPANAAAILAEITLLGAPGPRRVRERLLRSPRLRRLLLAPLVADPIALTPVAVAALSDGVDRPGLRYALPALRRDPPVSRAALIECPVTLVGTDRDRISPLAEVHALAARIPRASVLELAGLGHLPMLEDPLRFAALLRPLLAVT